MYRLLYKNIKGYKTLFYLSIIIKVFEVLAEVQIPMLMGKVFDEAIAGQRALVNNIILTILLYSLLAIVLTILSTISATVSMQGMGANLRQEIFCKIQSFTFADLNYFTKGTLISRVTGNVNSIASAALFILMTGVRIPIYLSMAIYKIVKLDSELSSYLVYGIIANILFLFLVHKLAVPLMRKYVEAMDELNEEVNEEVVNIENTRLFVQEIQVIGRFKRLIEKLCRTFARSSNLNLTIMPVCNLIIYLSITLITWKGGLLVLDGNFSAGQLLTFNLYISSMFMTILVLSSVIFRITVSIPILERINEVINHPIAFADSKDAVEEITDTLIEFKDVDFAYSADSPKVLENINLTIEPGSYVAIIGATGAGKSTLVQLLAHLHEVTSGKILLGGVEIEKYRQSKLIDQVAIVLQKNTLFSGTVRENLLMGRESADDEQLWQALDIAQATEFIREKDGLDTIVETYGKNFSGGQKQRLCIARTLLKRAPILILDDATSALDVTTEQKLQEQLVLQQPNTTIIHIAQRITAVQNADTIVVMDLGRIIACGTHQQLLNDCQIYQEICRSQEKNAKV